MSVLAVQYGAVHNMHAHCSMLKALLETLIELGIGECVLPDICIS